MTDMQEALPRPAAELAELASSYEEHSPLPDSEYGEWVEPRPMVTTSLRVSDVVLDALKQEAQRRGMRHTVLIRTILEDCVRTWSLRAGSSNQTGLTEVLDRLGRIEEKLDRGGHASA